MKKYFILALALALPLAALAQDTTVDSSVNTNARPAQVQTRLRVNAELEAKRAQMDAEREARRKEAEERRAEVRTAVQENRLELRRDVVERKLANTVRVMSATVERLESIANRIASRIEKFKARGANTSESERYLAAARANLSDAGVAIEALASAELSDETIRENFERIRALAANVREHLRSAHTNLMMAARSLSSTEIDLEADSNSTN